MGNKKREAREARQYSNDLAEIHRKILADILIQPKIIGEDGRAISSKIREISWKPNRNGPDSMVPDLIFVYFPQKRKYPEGYTVPVEIKVGNWEYRRAKAMRQLRAGIFYSEKVLCRPCDHARYVHFDSKGELVSEYIDINSLESL